MQKNYWRKHIILSLLIVAYTINPSAFYSQNEHFSFHHLTTDEGLSQASNDIIYHDSKGFIWLSSLDGLNRFDGKSVKIYKSIAGDSTSLLGNIITNGFFEDDQSNLWFSTYEGIHCYVRTKDHFQHFQLKNSKNQILKQDYSVFHLDNENQLWVRVGIGQEGKLYLFNTKTYKQEEFAQIDGHRNHPVLNDKGKVIQVVSYAFMHKKGMEILDIFPSPKVISLFDNDSNSNFNSSFFHVNFSTENDWFLSTKHGLILFNPDSKSHQTFNTYQNESIGSVFSSVTVNDSTIWASTTKHSLLVFDRKTKKFISQIPHDPQRKLGLQIKTVNKIYKDHQSNIWLTSGNSGIAFTNLDKRKFASPPEFLGQNMNAIFENSKGEIFCSHQDLTAYYAHSNAKVEYVDTQIPNNISKQGIQYFFQDKTDDLWATTRTYLLKWNASKHEFDYVQNLPNHVLYVYKNRHNRILFATYSGIFEWKKVNTKPTFVPFQALGKHQQNLVTAIYEDQKGQMYLALDASRLLILKLEGSEYVEFDQIEGIGYAKSFYEEEQNLWIATSTGILKINTETNESELLNEAENGAPNESYYSIIADENYSFWLSCNRGIIRYFPKEKKHRRYTLLDGLQGNEYNTNAFLKTSRGEVWMGGTNGLNRFFPNKIKDLPNLPKIQITRLQVNDEVYETSSQIGELSELELAYQNNTISFNFVALEYSDPKNNKLQYKLENHENEWVDDEQNGFARYSNLPSGQYIFKIKAANSDGVWNEALHELKIHIQTPWWQTWWFYLACISAISAIIFGVSRYRLQQALKIERMRVKISSDLHDDVGGILAGLTMQSELLELNATEERKPKLIRISELSRKAMSRMRDTVWAIDARKDKFENLLDRVREHAAEALELKNIAFDLTVENIELDKKMSSQIRQNLYLICKEAITNTAKHSNGNQLKIKFSKYGRNSLSVSIFDNGKVIEKSHKSSGLGLSNMQMRAEQINAQLEINHDNGFLIQLILRN